jgi:outer membrane protein OmpA-like peptidoglycan-associated protein
MTTPFASSRPEKADSTPWMRSLGSALALPLLLAVGVQPAEAGQELSGPTLELSGGWFLPDPDEELGQAWAFVPRAGWMFGPRVGLEAQYSLYGGQLPALGMPYSAMAPRADVFIDMAPDHWFRPFAAGGVGILWKKAQPAPGTVLPRSAQSSRFVRQNPHTDFLANFGGGVMVQMYGPWFFRTDGRLLLHWGEDPGGYPDGYSNVEITAGIAYRGGELTRDSDGDGVADRFDPCVNEAEDFDRFNDDDGCPDPDNDQDGILDSRDRCDDEPEDMDGFEDRDGCPEFDNDGDGVKDWNDSCPNQKEDLDGFDDSDGCPEGDNDGDGVPDDRDSCPNEPEDRDGSEDADGCPDGDNDGDGIPDGADSCPGQPETFNGHEDEDGCPDEQPPPPDTFDGVIPGINFKVGRAEITTSSYSVLDQVAGTLKKYPSIRIEVQGHTDSDGSSQSNLSLSARRARAVVEYLINRGVDPSRLEYVGYGESKPLVPNSTREQKAVNRRVEFRRLDI